jgi:phosphatidylglycerophosphate synthase
MPRFIIVVEGRRPGFRTELFRLSVIARLLNELGAIGETAVSVVSDAEANLRSPPGMKVDVMRASADQAALTHALSIAAIQPGVSFILPADRLFSRGFLRGVRSLAIDETRASKLLASSSPGDAHGAVLCVSPEVAKELLASAPTEIAGVAGTPLVVDGFSSAVRTPREIAAARRFLLHSVRKSMSDDGVVAYYFMRPLTNRITGLLARTPISPNHLTVLTCLIGLTGAALVAFGGRSPAVAGACLFFAAATADCLDGEIARLQYKASYLGAWLDTITDDFQTMLFIGACGSHLVRSGGGLLWPVLAAASMALFAGAQLYVYRVVHGRHSADPVDFRFVWDRDDGSHQTHPLFSIAKYGFKRDFYTLGFALLVIANAVAPLVLASFVANASRAAALLAHVWIVQRRRSA